MLVFAARIGYAVFARIPTRPSLKVTILIDKLFNLAVQHGHQVVINFWYFGQAVYRPVTPVLLGKVIPAGQR